MPPQSINRRKFIKFTASAIAVGTVAGVTASVAAPPPAIKAIAFDALAVFDLRPVFARAEELFPGHGAELSNVWRTRQFEYAWLRCLSRNYADFWQVTEEALVFAAKTLKLELSSQNREQLMAGYLKLKPWPDAVPVLSALKQTKIRIALLSNFSPKMLQAAVKSSKLENVFEHQLSTDAARTYKPDPRAYQLGVDTFRLRREQIAFVTFGGWDAAGARAFGYPTFWCNRQNLPTEELGVKPDATSATLEGLTKFAGVER